MRFPGRTHSSSGPSNSIESPVFRAGTSSPESGAAPEHRESSASSPEDTATNSASDDPRRPGSRDDNRGISPLIWTSFIRKPETAPSIHYLDTEPARESVAAEERSPERARIKTTRSEGRVHVTVSSDLRKVPVGVCAGPGPERSIV